MGAVFLLFCSLFPFPHPSFLGGGVQVNYDGGRKWYVEKSREATLGFEMIINNLFTLILTIRSEPFFATLMCLKLFKN